MPARQLPLVSGEVYHVLNRGNAALPIFKTKRDYSHFLRCFLYYQHSNPPIRFSKLLKLPIEKRVALLEKLKKKQDFLVEIIAYCLMPNHYHFLLKQVKNAGIVDFIRLSNGSYSRYFNTKHQRKGSLFEGRFKAVRVENESQLLHLSRYIHLNPFSSYVVRRFKELENYPWSSFPEYLGKSNFNYCKKGLVLTCFRDSISYKNFVFDRADYQRSLEEIKHQVLED